MLKIRLSRVGKNNQPSFRVVLQEHTSAVKGKFIEEMGFYRPAAQPKEFKVKLERIRHWLKMGAHPSDSLAVLLKKEGVENMEKFIAPRNKKHKKKGEAAPAAATPPTPAAKPAAEPAPKPAAAPTPKPAPEPAPKPAPEPAPKPAPEPAPKPAPEPDAKPAAEAKPAPAPEPASEPKPAAEPPAA